MTQVAAARPLPAGGWVERRFRKSDKRSAGVEVRHRADQRAHPLRVPARSCPRASAIITARASPTRAYTGIHLDEPADVVGLEVEAVVEAAVDPFYGRVSVVAAPPRRATPRCRSEDAPGRAHGAAIAVVRPQQRQPRLWFSTAPVSQSAGLHAACRRVPPDARDGTPESRERCPFLPRACSTGNYRETSSDLRRALPPRAAARCGICCRRVAAPVSGSDSAAWARSPWASGMRPVRKPSSPRS